MTDPDEHAGLVEYLPGQWMTPNQARARFSGGPTLPVADARRLAHMLLAVAASLLEQTEEAP